MILLHTALRIEAKPLIVHFGLKFQSIFNRISIHQNDDMILVQSGVGKIASATAISACLSRFDSIQAVINIGIAGSEKTSIGELIRVNQILDYATHQTHIPECIPYPELKTSSLISVDTAFTNNELLPPPYQLVDMEASAVYQSASYFLESHQIESLKIISDHLDSKKLSKDFIHQLFENKMNEIQSFIEWKKSKVEIERDDIKLRARNFAEKFNFTQTQQHQIEHFLRYHDLNNGNPISLESFSIPKTKVERNQLFNTIKMELLN